MQGILSLEKHMPDAIKAGIVTKEIADKCNIDKYKEHHKEIWKFNGVGYLLVATEGNESPYVTTRQEKQHRNECQNHRCDQKDCSENQPIDSLVFGSRNNHSFAIHTHVGTLAQKFIGQAICPFREQILRASPSAPDSTYRNIGDDRDCCEY